MNYWLFKSEPSTFSIETLANAKNQITHWDGVRNYQARNFMRDTMTPKDLGFFYHSNCQEIGIVGCVRVVSSAYPDFTAWDPEDPHFDPKSSQNQPRWFMVDVQLEKKFKHTITLPELKQNPLLKNMLILRRGNRLSITPLTAREWSTILKMAGGS